MSNSKKKKDLPAMPWYFGDWRKSPEIRALDLDVRMIWFEMLGYMWESTERGYLTINGKPVITPVISKMIGVDITQMQKALQQLEQFNVFSRREDGAIFCRKMVRDQEIREAKSAAGTEGMKKRYKRKKKSVITPPITKPENETVIENETAKVIVLKNEPILPFNSERFNACWQTWLEYRKKELGKTYKSVDSALKAMKHLFEISSGDEELAIKIIDRSIANQWQGLFEIKNTGTNGKATSYQQNRSNLESVRDEARKRLIASGGNTEHEADPGETE